MGVDCPAGICQDSGTVSTGTEENQDAQHSKGMAAFSSMCAFMGNNITGAGQEAPGGVIRSLPVLWGVFS